MIKIRSYKVLYLIFRIILQTRRNSHKQVERNRKNCKICKIGKNDLLKVNCNHSLKKLMIE